MIRGSGALTFGGAEGPWGPYLGTSLPVTSPRNPNLRLTSSTVFVNAKLWLEHTCRLRQP